MPISLLLLYLDSTRLDFTQDIHNLHHHGLTKSVPP